MSMRVVLVALLLLNAAAGVLGQCTASDLVGTWDGQGLDYYGDAAITFEVQFNSDETLSADASYTCDYDTDTCNQDYSGSYSYESTTNTLVFAATCESTSLPPCCDCGNIPVNLDRLYWAPDCKAFTSDVFGFNTTFYKQSSSDWWKYLLIALGACAGLGLIGFVVLVALKVTYSSKQPDFEGVPDEN